jgi:glycosyltransferase involved in cell wall biosynthesis
MDDAAARPPTVTIITPVYNEEANLPPYVQAVSEVLMASPGYEFRVLFIDDGSTDRSWQ